MVGRKERPSGASKAETNSMAVVPAICGQVVFDVHEYYIHLETEHHAVESTLIRDDNV